MVLSLLRRSWSALSRPFTSLSRREALNRVSPRRNTRARLSLEQLEDRITPVTITWIGTSNVNELWSTGANWDLNRAPLATDDIVFKNNSDMPVASTEDINFTTPVKSLSILGYAETITFNVPVFQVVTMQQTSGIINGNGQFIIMNGGGVNGSYDWSGGQIGNHTPGDEFIVRVASGTTMTIQSSLEKKMDYGIIEDYGTVNWKDSGNIVALDGADFFVRSGGIFNGAAGNAQFDGSGAGANLFKVWSGGTYNETSGSQHNFTINVILNGTWNVTQGQSFFTGGSTVAGATINITQFGALNLQSTTFFDSENFWTGTTVTGLGRLTLADPFGRGCTLSVTGNVTVSMLQQAAAGTVTGTGNLIITREYVMGADSRWGGGGGVMITPNATLNVYITSDDGEWTLNRTLNNGGTVNFYNADNLTMAAGMNIVNNGTMNFLNPFSLSPAAQGAAATLTNNGTMNFDVAGAGLVSVALPFTNTGTLNVKQGTAEFTLAVTQSSGSTNLLGGTLRSLQQYNIQAGMLTGVGTIQALEVRNNGLVRLGNTTNPFGDLTMATLAGVQGSGRYVQTMQGTLTLSLGGTQAGQFNRLHVQGQASLAGILTVSLVAPYMPQAGATFDLMDFASLDPNANHFGATPPGWTTSFPNGTGVRIVRN